jgi:hypothetical protein
MKKIILHIGPHKTGSTYLQKKLLEASELLESNGFLYPRDQSLSQYAQHDLALPKNFGDFRSLIEKFTALPDHIHTLLISSENFDRLKQVEVLELSKLIKIPIEVVFFHRQASKLLYSSWQEEVKSGSGKSMELFLLEEFFTPFQSEILNQSLVLDRWVAAFGLEFIKVFDYDLLMGRKLDIVDAFVTKILSESLPSIADGERINGSFSVAFTELLRAYNMRFEPRRNNFGYRVRDALIGLQKSDSRVALLENLVKEDIKPVELKNSTLMVRCREQFLKHYESNFVTEVMSSSQDLQVQISQGKWIFNPKAIELFDGVGNAIAEKIGLKQ